MQLNKPGGQARPSSGDEVDFIHLATLLWEGRRTVIKTVVIFALAGLLIALLSPEQYTATTTMVPQETENQPNLGGLSGLAAMAGVNLNSMTGNAAINPVIYPRIVASLPFQLRLMETRLSFSDLPQPVTLYDYFTEIQGPSVGGTVKKYTIGLPGVLLKALRGEQQVLPADSAGDPIRLTEEQRRLQKKLKKLIEIEYDEDEKYLSLTCRMPEALPAAQLATRTQALLQEYVTDFRVQKALANLDFIEKRYFEVRTQYNKAQETLARFRDQNKNVSTAMAQTELERLSNDYDLAYTIYSELAKQLEQAKIRVKEDTPVFTVIEPPSVPFERSKPQRVLILAIWTFLGGVTGIGIIYGRAYIEWIKRSRGIGGFTP